MLYYGGTPLAYFVAFSLPLAVFSLLRIGMGNEKVRSLVDFKNPKHARNHLTSPA